MSGPVTGSVSCDGNTSTSVYTTAGLTLSPNTCYFLMIWTKVAPTSSASTCIYTQTPAYDNCSGALPISSTSTPSNNYCTTPGPTTNSPTITPAMLCAGSLENTAWYRFTLLTTGNVVLTISGIVCYGGGAGFQIGYFSGACGTLSNIGCTSGSGGTVTVTITGGVAGQTIYVAIDGNAGANCTYSISATNTVPLPVELLDFNAFYSKESKNVLLDWATYSEMNNDYFILEKSMDGKNFEFYQNIKGAGTSNMPVEYKTIDNKPFDGITYYRLKQTDYDGTSEYVGTIAVKANKSNENVALIPNPVLNNAEINFNSSSNGITHIQIIDITGKQVYVETITAIEGSNRFMLNTENYNKGLYFLVISNEFGTEKLKFVKE